MGAPSWLPLAMHAEGQLSSPPTCSKLPVHQVHLCSPCCYWRRPSTATSEPGFQPWPRDAHALNTLHSGHWLTWDGPSGAWEESARISPG